MVGIKYDEIEIDEPTEIDGGKWYTIVGFGLSEKKNI